MEVIVSIVPAARQAATRAAGGKVRRRRARFAARMVGSSALVLSVGGEIDAFNARELTDTAERQLDSCGYLVVDLGEVDFLGIQGFSALHTVNVRCAQRGLGWTLIPSPAVTRVLRICDPEGALPLAHSVAAALTRGPARHLRLL